MTPNRTWPFGAVWGLSVAAAATVLLIAAAVLAPAQARVEGPLLPRLLLAWWIATPLCGVLAASRIDLFRRVHTAMGWGVVCAVPWVITIRGAAAGVLPSSASDWSGISVRALALGAAGGIVVWRTLHPRCPARPATPRPVRGWARRPRPPRSTPARGPVLLLSARPDVTARLCDYLQRRGRSVTVLDAGAIAGPIFREPAPEVVIWDIAQTGQEALDGLGALLERFPGARLLLLDRAEGPAAVRLAPYVPGPRITRATFEVAIWGARWTRGDTLL